MRPQTGEPIEYGACCIEPEQFETEVAAFFAGGGKGLNITVPFKQRAWTLAEQRSPRAERAGAVNTLYLDAAGRLTGDNTDGVGLVRDLQENRGVDLQGARVLMLGAGGAVRGVLQPLLAAGCGEILIANRTLSRAESLVQEFSDLGQLRSCGFDSIEPRPFDLIVNGTSASLQGALPPLPTQVIGDRSACYDMMYGAAPTPFCAWALEQGAALVADGLGMLVEQAAESFRIWRGVRPQSGPVIAAIRAELGA